VFNGTSSLAHYDAGSTGSVHLITHRDALHEGIGGHNIAVMDKPTVNAIDQMMTGKSGCMFLMNLIDKRESTA
jgi:hypothetical protein